MKKKILEKFDGIGTCTLLGTGTGTSLNLIVFSIICWNKYLNLFFLLKYKFQKIKEIILIFFLN